MSPASHVCFLGKLMRQAKPDDVLQFVQIQDIAQHWDKLERYLGRRRSVWHWMLRQWELRGLVHR